MCALSLSISVQQLTVFLFHAELRLFAQNKPRVSFAEMGNLLSFGDLPSPPRDGALERGTRKEAMKIRVQ